MKGAVTPGARGEASKALPPQHSPSHLSAFLPPLQLPQQGSGQGAPSPDLVPADPWRCPAPLLCLTIPVL